MMKVIFLLHMRHQGVFDFLLTLCVWMMLLYSRATRLAHFLASLSRLCSSAVPLSFCSSITWDIKTPAWKRLNPENMINLIDFKYNFLVEMLWIFAKIKSYKRSSFSKIVIFDVNLFLWRALLHIQRPHFKSLILKGEKSF